MRLGLLAKETHDTVIRLAPPLVITKDEIDVGLERLAAVLTADVPEEVSAGT
jgi:ornithine--oxo-acid transaminase